MMRIVSSRALTAAVAFGALALAGCESRPAPASNAPPPAQQAAPPQAPAATLPPAAAQEQPVVRGYKGRLPPLPSGYVPARPPEVVSAVYEFAARQPQVLRYVPCFCGCERNGHQHNADCFVASREPDGRPNWDAHGLG